MVGLLFEWHAVSPGKNVVCALELCKAQPAAETLFFKVFPVNYSNMKRCFYLRSSEPMRVRLQKWHIIWFLVYNSTLNRLNFDRYISHAP